MQLIIKKTITAKWYIIGHENYVFGEDKKMYNIKTGREIKKTINCRSIGWWIGKKFYSKNKLRPFLKKIEKKDCPF